MIAAQGLTTTLIQERDVARAACTRLEAEKRALTGLLGEYQNTLLPHYYCRDRSMLLPPYDFRCDLCKRTDALLNPREYGSAT